MCGNHLSIFFFIKFNTQLIQPFNGIRCFHDQTFYQLRSSCKMSAAETVQIMLYRRIVFLISCLNAAFRHHGICVTDAQFGDDHNICTCIVCFNGTGRACTASADYQDIHIIVNLGKVNLLILDTACRVEHMSQLTWCSFSFIWTHLDFCKCIRVIIWMKFF